MESTILCTTPASPAGNGGPSQCPAKVGAKTRYVSPSGGINVSHALADEVAPWSRTMGAPDESAAAAVISAALAFPRPVQAPVLRRTRRSGTARTAQDLR